MAIDPGPAAREWVVEPYRPGDEEAILALFNAEFGLTRSMRHWRWKFLENPYGGPFISLAWHRATRQLVGNQVLMPVPLNVGGRRVLAGHSLDLVVHHDFRRQGIHEHTGRHAMETLRQAGGEALFAFPNASSYPGFVRSQGWSRILEPTAWTLRLGVRRKLARRLGPLAPLAGVADVAVRAAARARLERAVAAARAATPAVRAAHGASVPGDVDALWAREAAVAELSLWKDATYLGWRYGQNPDHRFTWHRLDVAGIDGPAALAVTVVRDGAAILCELLVPSRDAALGRRLVGEACLHHAAGGAIDEVRFLGHDAGFFAAALAGFTAAPAPANVFVGRAIADDALTARMADAGRWSLTYGDADFV